jgi:ribosome-binding factor A
MAKIREEIKRQLGEILEFEARDPRLEFVTVMDVRVSPDLQRATVYISTVGEELSEEEVVKVMEEHRGFFRSELAKRLRLRRTPELHFEIDFVERYARRIEQLLQQEREKDVAD